MVVLSKLAGIAGMIALAAFAFPVLAQQPGGGDQSLRIKTDVSGKTKINLTQSAKKTLPRNRIKIDLRVEVQGDSSKELQSQINRKMPGVFEITNALPSIWVETGSYRVFREPESNAHPERWHAIQDISIFSDNFADALSAAGKCQAIGLLMTNMMFFLSPETMQDTQSELTKTALDALRARADEVATDLNMKIDHYQNISVGNAFESGETSKGAGGSNAANAQSGPAAQGGQSTIILNVSADVLLTAR